MSFARVGETLIHYEFEGPAVAPVIVFSNSLGTDFRIWDRLIEILGDDFRTVRYDKRGHGLSDVQPAPYTIEDHAGDLIGLLDHLEITDAIVCGLSVGGMRRSCRSPDPIPGPTRGPTPIATIPIGRGRL